MSTPPAHRSTEFADPARLAALRLLRELEDGSGRLEPLLLGLETELADRRDRHFARQLVLGVLRWQGRIDWIVDRFSRRPIASCSSAARQLLRLGVYQLLWLDRVPPSAAVHTSVEMAKQTAHRGVAALVNAVLRRVATQGDRVEYPSRQQDLAGHLAVYLSHPRWLVERWLARWGESATEALLRADDEPAPLFVHHNTHRGDAAQLCAALQADGLELAPAGPLPGYFSVPEPAGLFQSQAWRDGLFQVQDANAGLAAALLDPQPGEQVLDLCSAPGGKAAQLAMAMQDRGLVVAADRSRARLLRVRENAARLRLRCIAPVVADARADGGGGFDRVLADVPCTGTGTLGRRPDARWRRQADQLPGLVAAQEAILAQGFARLRPGGVLVYSTCSLEEEENAQVVERFLAAVPQAELEPAAGRFPGQVWADRYVQTLPGREPGDGSFAARIRRKEQ